MGFTLIELAQDETAIIIRAAAKVRSELRRLGIKFNIYAGRAWWFSGLLASPHLRQRSLRLLALFQLSVFSTHVLQIVFNEISAAEISRLDTLEQLELLDAFKVSESDLKDIDGEHGDDGQHLGKMVRDGTTLYRFRTDDYRIYFEVSEKSVIVHRVMNKNSISDFLFRSKMPLSEDEELSKSKHFWKLIDEGRNARRM